MDNILGTLAVAIISSGSALLAGYLTNRAAEKRQDKQIELEKQRELQKTKLLKAEEIYSALHKYKMMAFTVQMDWVSLAREEITLSEMNKKAAERKNEDPAFLHAKLGIYFPDLLEGFEKAREMLKPANDCYFKMIRGNALSKEVKQSYVNTILNSGVKFDSEIDKILKRLSAKVNGFEN